MLPTTAIVAIETIEDEVSPETEEEAEEEEEEEEDNEEEGFPFFTGDWKKQKSKLILCFKSITFKSAAL